MKKKIAIPVIILVGIIVIGLSALWQNGYLDMNTPVVYKYSDNCVFDGNFYYTVSDENEVCIEGIRRIADTVEIPESIDGKPLMEKGLMKVLGISEWSEDRLKEIRHTYLAMCAKIDFQVGRLISALRDEGIYDSTAVIVLSDHGDYTTDYGIVEKMSELLPGLPYKRTLYYQATE